MPAETMHEPTAPSIRSDEHDKVAKLQRDLEKAQFDAQYKEMGVMQLAKEAAIARKDGNSAREGLITEALEHHLTMDAMKDDSESPAEAQARYESEIMRYEELVVKFSAGETSKIPPFPGDLEAAKATTSEAQEATQGTEAPKDGTEAAAAGEAEPKLDTTEVTLNGEKVSIGDVFENPDGQRVVEIVAEDGTKKLVYESDLVFSEAAAADSADKAGNDATEAKNEAAATDTAEPNGDAAPAGTEVDTKEATNKDEKADPRVEQEREAARLQAEKDQKLTERVKNWFQKEGKKFQEFGGKAYMAGLFEAGARGVKTGVNRMLEWRVKEDMTPEEKDKIRKQNRYGAIAFGAAAAALTIGLLAANGMNSDGGGAEVPTPTPTETVDPGLQDILNPGGAAGGESQTGSGPGNLIPDWDGPVGGGEVTPDVPATPEVVVPNEAFNIPSGGGGEALFGDLNIDTTKWYDNEDALLANFPNELYRMDSGHVGISRPGLLSQGLQDAINALK